MPLLPKLPPVLEWDISELEVIAYRFTSDAAADAAFDRLRYDLDGTATTTHRLNGRLADGGIEPAVAVVCDDAASAAITRLARWEEGIPCQPPRAIVDDLVQRRLLHCAAAVWARSRPQG